MKTAPSTRRHAFADMLYHQNQYFPSANSSSDPFRVAVSCNLLLAPPAFPASSLSSITAFSALSTLLPLASFSTTFTRSSLSSSVAAATHGESSCGETVGEVDLSADGVGEVGDEQDVLDVVVAVTVC